MKPTVLAVLAAASLGSFALLGCSDDGNDTTAQPLVALQEWAACSPWNTDPNQVLTCQPFSGNDQPMELTAKSGRQMHACFVDDGTCSCFYHCP